MGEKRKKRGCVTIFLAYFANYRNQLKTEKAEIVLKTERIKNSLRKELVEE